MYLFRGDCLGLKDQHPGCGNRCCFQPGWWSSSLAILANASYVVREAKFNQPFTAYNSHSKKNSIWTELRSRFKARQQENTNPPAATLVLASGFVCVRALKKCGKLTFSVMLDDDAKAWSLNLCAMVASTSSWLRWAMGRLWYCLITDDIGGL